MDAIEQDEEIAGVERQENERRSGGFALNGQRVELKEVLNRPQERLNARPMLPIRRQRVRPVP